MEVNVSNIPLNTLYRFDINKYIWKTKIHETRGGKHKQDIPFIVTEVYEITQEGFFRLVASGKLTTEPGKRDFREFGIFDYDKNVTNNFKTTMHLEELKLNEWYELRDAVRKTYNRNKNK